MIKLDPYEVCPFGSFCGYSIESFLNNENNLCYGLNKDRKNVFICELWAENYEKGVLKNARDDGEFS